MARDPRRSLAASFDPVTAKTAAVNTALLTLVLRPVEPMSDRYFADIVVAVAVLLAVAERRRAGDRRGR